MIQQSSLPTKTTAAILQKQKSPLVVDTIDLPAALSFGQVLVKVHTTTICGSQVNEIDGTKGPDRFLPHLLGHEGSGVVVAIGDGVQHVAPGDHVVLHWRPGNGLVASPAQYRWHGKQLNAGWVTTFQEYTVVSENRVTKIPADFDLSLAPLFGCAVTTAMGVITNEAQVKIGQSIVVFGVGGVGLNVVQAAALAGAYPIIAVDVVAEKLSLAQEFGATHIVHSSHGVETQSIASLQEKIIDVVGSAGADVVVDTTGIASVAEQAYELTQPVGKTILVGVMDHTKKVTIKTLPLHFGKVLRGSHGGLSQPAEDIPRFIRLVEAGKLRLNGLITHQFPLPRINEAIALMRSGTAGRIAVSFE